MENKGVSKNWFEKNCPKLYNAVINKPVLYFLDGSISTKNQFFPHEQDTMEMKASLFFNSGGFAKGKINLSDSYGSKNFKMIMN